MEWSEPRLHGENSRAQAVRGNQQNALDAKTNQKTFVSETGRPDAGTRTLHYYSAGSSETGSEEKGEKNRISGAEICRFVVSEMKTKPACSCMSLLRCPITEKSCKASGQTFGHSWMHYGMFASQRRALQQGVTLVGWGHGARGSAASPDQATGSHVLTEAQKRLPSFAYSPSPFFNMHERCTLV